MKVKIESTITGGGLLSASKLERDADSLIGHEITTMPAGQAGTLSTRTTDNTGVVTLGSGHGLTTADKVDVYFGTDAVQYDCAITLTDSTTITIGSGVGDVLPSQSSAVVVGKRVTIESAFDGDDVKLITAWCSLKGHIDFRTGADANVHAQALEAAAAWSWATDQGTTNPLSGTAIATIEASCGEVSTADATLRIIGVRDGTP